MPTATDSQAILTQLQQWALAFDVRLAELLAQACPAATPPDRLVEAIRYAALSPGKRLRPFLACKCASLFGMTEDDTLDIAAAIECVHAFSLVHDDLPAMDDDDLRRGRPTTHVVYGEALAILAGDALLSLAFELVALHAPDAQRTSAITLELARAVGAGGMIGGQADDIQAEGSPAGREVVERIHRRKTARLLGAACKIGAIQANANDEALLAVERYGTELGLAFQITDDLLDLTASAEHLGKDVGKDQSAGKQTFPACVGVDESRRIAANHVQRAVDALAPFGEAAADLKELARLVLERTR